jgi:P pilus assembly chaperone PapD
VISKSLELKKIMNIQKCISVLFLIVALVMPLSTPARADVGGVLVYPNILELDFSKSPRKFVSKAIMVENKNNKKIRVRAYPENWDLDEFGGMTFNTDNLDDSLAGYVKFNPREFDLEPNQKQLVRLTAKLPEDLNGEKRGIIFFETVTPKEKLVKSSDDKLGVLINFVTRYGVTLYAYNGELSRNAELLDFGYGKYKDRKALKVTLKNDGNVHSYVKGKLTLTAPHLAKPIDVPVKKHTLLPGRTQTMVIRIPPKIEEGKTYKALLEINHEDITGKQHKKAAETVFTAGKPAAETDIKEYLEKPITIDELEHSDDTLSQPVEL